MKPCDINGAAWVIVDVLFGAVLDYYQVVPVLEVKGEGSHFNHLHYMGGCLHVGREYDCECLFDNLREAEMMMLGRNIRRAEAKQREVTATLCHLKRQLKELRNEADRLQR